MNPKIADRIRAALSSRSMDPQQLAKVVAASPAELQAELRRLATSGHIHNVGSEEYPMWTWRIGDQTSSEELVKAVIRMLGERPTTTRELANATGADLRRVALAVRAIQRGPDRERLIALGVDREAATWLMLPGGATPAAPLRPEAPAR